MVVPIDRQSGGHRRPLRTILAATVVLLILAGSGHSTHYQQVPPDRFDADCTRISLSGASDHDRAATRLLAAHDFTGDGLPDLVVGVPRATVSGTIAGATYLVSLPLDQPPGLQHAHTVLLGPSGGSQAGRSIAPAGDLNGDGVPDLVIGAPTTRKPGSAPGGAAFVFYGPVAPGTRSLWTADAIVLGGPEHALGTSVAGVGDVNGDGADDLLVGAPGLGTLSDRHGGAFLFHGPLAGTYEWHQADVSLVGKERDGQAGFAVAPVGDVDGDGRADLAIAAPQARSARGLVHVVHGVALDGPDFALSDATATWIGESPSDAAGELLMRLPDGPHGADTLLVGAPAATVDGITRRGTVYLIDAAQVGSPALADPTTRFIGPPKSSGFGTSAAAIGDLDQDGIRDLAIGAPSHSAGTVHVYGGYDVRNGTVPPGAADHTFHGVAQWSGYGLSVAGADLDHDGQDDLVVGIPGEHGVGTGRGAIRAFDHGPMTLDTDGDRLLDACERHRYHTDPERIDSDGDHLYDGEEVLVSGSDPLDRDTDGDLHSDLAEVVRHTDPRNPFSFPVLGTPVHLPVSPPFQEMPITDDLDPIY